MPRDQRADPILRKPHGGVCGTCVILELLNTYVKIETHIQVVQGLFFTDDCALPHTLASCGSGPCNPIGRLVC